MVADDIGDRGQWLFCLLMTQICPGRNEPYFRPRFLGDKHATFDYLVELVGSEAYFFFAQVKSTRQGYRQGSGARRLRVNVDRQDVQRMVASPIPAYVVGIDEPQEVGYVLSMNEPRQAGLGGLPARHMLDYGNLQRLWQEVHNFWASRNMVLAGSYFM
ncbi:MAG TPA: DUF4365 domain-containing protein [Gemmataceae bacterium]|nr:DUF4365 domain-containing protein [Gemmataceae bacterium]